MTGKKSGLDWGKVVRLGLILFAITAVCSAALAFANSTTYTIIEERNKEANVLARQEVLSEADRFEEIEDLETIAKEISPDDSEMILEAFVGYKGNDIVGYTVKTNPKGYAGGIEMLTGFLVADKSIEAITIINQSETPGLGAKAADPEFQDQFKGKDGTQPIIVGQGGADNQIDAITGATITSNAVAKGVNLSEQVFLKLIDSAQNTGQESTEKDNKTSNDTTGRSIAETHRLLSGFISFSDLFSKIMEAAK